MSPQTESRMTPEQSLLRDKILGELAELAARAERPRPERPRVSFEDWAALLVDPSWSELDFEGLELSKPVRRDRSEKPPGFFIPDETLKRLSNDFRAALHPDGAVTYVVDRNINYSNICASICNFCAFYRSPGEEGGYVLSYEEIFRKVEETLELGGSGILMQGGLHPDLPLEWYTTLLRELKKRYGIHLHCFSPTEIHGLMEVTGLPAREILLRLKEAGLDSMPGGGGEILVDEVRRKRRSKVDSREWLDVMEAAHDFGIPTTATMMFGHGETPLHRLEHLEKIRRLQDRTGGFISFILWNFQPDNTPLGKILPERMGAEEYLRWLAVSRLYLDNIPNLQVSWLTQGLDVGREGLLSGANDLGSTMIEENVIRPAGASHEATEEALRRTIRDAGFVPTLRNAAYRRLKPREAVRL